MQKLITICIIVLSFATNSCTNTTDSPNQAVEETKKSTNIVVINGETIVSDTSVSIDKLDSNGNRIKVEIDNTGGENSSSIIITGHGNVIQTKQN